MQSVDLLCMSDAINGPGCCLSWDMFDIWMTDAL